MNPNPTRKSYERLRDHEVAPPPDLFERVDARRGFWNRLGNHWARAGGWKWLPVVMVVVLGVGLGWWLARAGGPPVLSEATVVKAPVKQQHENHQGFRNLGLSAEPEDGPSTEPPPDEQTAIVVHPTNEVSSTPQPAVTNLPKTSLQTSAVSPSSAAPETTEAEVPTVAFPAKHSLHPPTVATTSTQPTTAPLNREPDLELRRLPTARRTPSVYSTRRSALLRRAVPPAPQLDRITVHMEFLAGGFLNQSVVRPQFVTDEAYAALFREENPYKTGSAAAIRIVLLYESGWNLRTGVDFQRIGGPNPSFRFIETTGRPINRLNQVSIPVLIGYEWNSNRIRWNIHGGISANVHAWQRGHYVTRTGSYQRMHARNQPGFMQTYRTLVGTSLVGGVGANLPLWSGYRLVLEPQYRHYLGNFTNGDFVLEHTHRNFGLMIGLRKRL